MFRSRDLLTKNKASTPDVKDHVSQALDNGGFKDISVDVNNDKELVTLKGDVKSQDEKDRVEQLAKSAADGYVISNELGVRPEGVEGQAKSIDKNVDSAIEKEFKAVLIANRLDKERIKYSANNGVLTLKGKVDNVATREQAVLSASTNLSLARGRSFLTAGSVLVNGLRGESSGKRDPNLSCAPSCQKTAVESSILISSWRDSLRRSHRFNFKRYLGKIAVPNNPYLQVI